MTGPGPGKIRLDAKVLIIIGSKEFMVNADTYLHIRGWSRAFVTHLDLESNELNSLIAKPRSGFYARAIYRLHKLRVLAERAIQPCVIIIEEHDVLPKVFNEGTNTWVFVGGKVGGVFIGFRREFIRRFEAVAKELFGIEPRSA